MDERDAVRVRHMLDAIRRVIRFTQDRTRADLEADELLALAVVPQTYPAGW